MYLTSLYRVAKKFKCFNKFCEKYPVFSFKDINILYQNLQVYQWIVQNEMRTTDKLVKLSKKRNWELTVIGKFYEFNKNAVCLKVYELLFF